MIEDRKKYLPLSKRGEGTPREPIPEEPYGIYPCPCCKNRTFPIPKEDAVAFICPVCLWENDVFVPAEDAPSDENRGMTLLEGRENYRRYGAIRPDLVQYARMPRPEELPET